MIIVKCCNVLFANLYLPCYSNDEAYTTTLCDIFAIVSDAMDKNPCNPVVVGGDVNFHCLSAHCALTFKNWANIHHLRHVPLSASSDTDYTYCNHRSCIDHFIVSDDVIDDVVSLNTSDRGITYPTTYHCV